MRIKTILHFIIAVVFFSNVYAESRYGYIFLLDMMPLNKNMESADLSFDIGPIFSRKIYHALDPFYYGYTDRLIKKGALHEGCVHGPDADLKYFFSERFIGALTRQVIDSDSNTRILTHHFTGSHSELDDAKEIKGDVSLILDDQVIASGGFSVLRIEDSAVDFLNGCHSVRLSSSNGGHTPDERIQLLIDESSDEHLEKAVSKHLAEDPLSLLFHYVKASDTGGWEYGVLIISSQGHILVRERCGIEY